MRAVDTSVLVRLQARDDLRQTAAAELFVAGGVWVPLIALVEMTWVLQAVYDRSHAQLAGALERMLDHRNLVLEDAELVAGALEHFRRAPSIGFSDCLILERCRRAGHTPLGTFDRRLGRMKGAERL
jgi:predicted nucleic-acid-binding protein